MKFALSRTRVKIRSAGGAIHPNPRRRERVVLWEKCLKRKKAEPNHREKKKSEDRDEVGRGAAAHGTAGRGAAVAVAGIAVGVTAAAVEVLTKDEGIEAVATREAGDIRGAGEVVTHASTIDDEDKEVNRLQTKRR
jgi:hypothetical protein